MQDVFWLIERTIMQSHLKYLFKYIFLELNIVPLYTEFSIQTSNM